MKQMLPMTLVRLVVPYLTTRTLGELSWISKQYRALVNGELPTRVTEVIHYYRRDGDSDILSFKGDTNNQLFPFVKYYHGCALDVQGRVILFDTCYFHIFPPEAVQGEIDEILYCEFNLDWYGVRECPKRKLIYLNKEREVCLSIIRCSEEGDISYHQEVLMHDVRLGSCRGSSSLFLTMDDRLVYKDSESSLEFPTPIAHIEQMSYFVFGMVKLVAFLDKHQSCHIYLLSTMTLVNTITNVTALIEHERRFGYIQDRKAYYWDWDIVGCEHREIFPFLNTYLIHDTYLIYNRSLTMYQSLTHPIPQHIFLLGLA